MALDNLPLLPTTVIGSYALPSWQLTALLEIEKGNYGQTDAEETFDDAVNIAIMDQERAGVDIISDGEMRRWYFVQSFTERMTGIIPDRPLRTIGPYGYDSPQRYHANEKITVPDGLGIVEEFAYSRTRTSTPIKVTCPGPLTISMHIRPGKVYSDRLEMAWEFTKVINTELKRLVETGAEFIQIDEPSFAIIPGSVHNWVELYNACIKDVNAKNALHICFGNLASRPRGRRRYDWMFPDLLEAKADQFVLEFANREMRESDLWQRFDIDRELGAGVIDVKSFYIETPDDVADHIRELLEYTPVDKIFINPDCGFFQLPRWISRLKLHAMVRGTKLVRQDFGV